MSTPKVKIIEVKVIQDHAAILSQARLARKDTFDYSQFLAAQQNIAPAVTGLASQALNGVIRIERIHARALTGAFGRLLDLYQESKRQHYEDSGWKRAMSLGMSGTRREAHLAALTEMTEVGAVLQKLSAGHARRFIGASMTLAAQVRPTLPSISYRLLEHASRLPIPASIEEDE